MVEMTSRHTTSSSSERLFACTNCHKRSKFEDLSSSQQLCKVCRKQFPLVTCTYCRLEFHPVKNSENPSRPTCEHCTRDLRQYGPPSACTICSLQSAFNGRKCSRCGHSEKKYGSPSLCEHCNITCAFPKPDEVKKKVDGKTLCLLCTIKYKKDQFKKRNGHSTVPSSATTSTTTTATTTTTASKRYHYTHHSSEHKAKQMDTADSRPSLKKLKVDFAANPLLQSHYIMGTRDTQPGVDLLTSNHILETDKLQNEISSLKKQLQQKELALLEKDKQICQLKADTSEKERDFRNKQISQQKAHGELVEQLQSEMRSLRTQLSKLSQKKTSSNVSDKHSSLASITSSLAATPTSS